MALAFQNIRTDHPDGVAGRISGVVDITLDGLYVNGGWAITPENLDLNAIHTVMPQANVNGYRLEWDHNNNKLKAINPTAVGASTAVAIMTDDDSAASNGTDVVCVPTAIDDGYGQLMSTTANNATAQFQLGSGGPLLNIYDSDSPGGVAIYYDEDATMDKLQCVNVSLKDIKVRCTGGEEIRIAYNADAATNGVAVHFDDNATNAYERLLFISPTNADGTFEGINQAGKATLSGAVVRCYYSGT